MEPQRRTLHPISLVPAQTTSVVQVHCFSKTEVARAENARVKCEKVLAPLSDGSYLPFSCRAQCVRPISVEEAGFSETARTVGPLTQSWRTDEMLR